MKYIIVYLMFIPAALQAQKLFTLQEAKTRILEVHPAVKSVLAEEHQQRALRGTVTEIPKTDISLMYGQYNSAIKNDNNITISQTLPFPTVWAAQRNLVLASLKASETKTAVVKNDLLYAVSSLYEQILFEGALQQLLQKQDSLYNTLVKSSTLRYNVGEGTLLEKTAIETQSNELKNLLQQNLYAYENDVVQLQLLLQLEQPIQLEGKFEALQTNEESADEIVLNNPSLQYSQHQATLARLQKKVESSRALPDLMLGYFNQTLIGYQTINGQEQYFGANKRFQGFTVGIAIPLWLKPYTAKIKAADLHYQATAHNAEAQRITLHNQVIDKQRILRSHQNNLNYYQDSALPNARFLEQQTVTSFKSGEVDYSTFLMNMRQSLSIQENYLKAIHQYNQSLLELEHLKGSQNL